MDFVRVRVRGEFARSGSSQLIPPDLVSQTRRTKARGFEKLPIIMACDVARFGDDQTVIGMRQGRKFQILGKYYRLDTAQVAERIIAFRDKHSPDAVVADGDGLGAGVVDQLGHRGYNKGLFEFHGGERPRDFNVYFNRRSEVWGLMRDWFHNGGVEIPDDPGTGSRFNRTRLRLQQQKPARAARFGMLIDQFGTPWTINYGRAFFELVN